MTKKTSLNAFMVLLLVVALFASCSAEVKNNSTAAESKEYIDLSIEISGEVSKAIDTLSTGYDAGLTIDSYQYKATCSTTPGAQGTQSTWATLENAPGSASISQMARGTWTIEVRALNSTGGVILYGSNTINLSTTNDTIAIVLTNAISGQTASATPADVTVSFGVTVPAVTGAQATLKYIPMTSIAGGFSTGTAVSLTAHANKVSEISGNTIVATTDSEHGETAYTGTVNLQPGFYAMQFLYVDTNDSNNVMSGQTFAFRVAENAPFAINGTLTAGELIDLSLSPISVNDRYISVSFSTDAACNGTNLTAAVTAGVQSGGGTLASTNYYWYVDGESVTNTGSNPAFTCAYTKTGTHILSCIVTGTIDGVPALGYASSEFTTTH